MKRFWSAVNIEGSDGRWSVLLDSRPVRSPARRPIEVPLRQMAEEIAAEWDAQDELVNPLSMPMTRAAATCLDRVEPEQQVVAETIAAYGETDLLCYRADHPTALVAREAERWDPLLDWSEEVLGARLNTATGVMFVAQPPQAIAVLAQQVHACGPWTLTSLAELTTISGSLVLALAVLHGRLDGPAAWALSRLDNDWNIEQWGEDHEETLQAARKETDFLHASRLIRMYCGTDT